MRNVSGILLCISKIKFYLQLIKVDTFRKTKKMWQENGVYPSEPIFVPNPNGKVSSKRLFIWKNKKGIKLIFSNFFFCSERGRRGGCELDRLGK